MSEGVSWLSIIYMVGLLILVLPTALFLFRQPSALRNIAIWVALFAGLVWGYHYMVEVPKMEAESITRDGSSGKGASSDDKSLPLDEYENQSPVRNM